MIIDRDLCTGCEACCEYCPVNAIGMDADLAYIDLELCTECNNCLRADVCPTDAIFQNELGWPRSIRNIFSDPISVFKETGVSGRGTEESKTNDVTHRFKKLGVSFDSDNPLTYLMADTKTGKLKEDVLDEFVVSAIIEFKTPLTQCVEIVKTLEEISDRINTVFSVGVISRVEEDWSIPAQTVLQNAGFALRPQGKTTLNLGRTD
jgi:NAD-dependent dihydropyrimidine dehydrogenase PreA subunit